jgi:membrane associated rhomboid family serine protease
MGLYDREYYREERRSGIHLAGDWSAVTTLVVINAAIFLADAFTQDQWLAKHLSLRGDLFAYPWQAWQLITYGFVHGSIFHIFFNMMGLWFFGSEVETLYGKREFYKLYLSLIILSGLANVAIQNALQQPLGLVYGASGAVMGTVVIFACNFPHRTIVLFPIPIPVPAYILAIGYVVLDLVGAQHGGTGVAHWAHLSGAAFGFVYYKTGWNLFRLWPRSWKVKLPSRGPKFRIHREPDDDEPESEPENDYLTTGRLQARVDQLLEKISTSGESSLTNEERQFLADAARRYQQRRR